MKTLDYSTITLLEASINYTILHLANGERKLVCHTLKRFEEQLKRNPAFFRIHRRYIVNKAYVVDTIQAREVVLQSGQSIPIARRRRGAGKLSYA